MKQGEVILACKTLDKILRLEIPFGLKAKVYNFRKKFQAPWEFQLDQEREIIDKAQKEEADGKTTVSASEMKKVNEQLAALANTKIEVDYKPLVIEINDAAAALSALDDADFKALDKFVNWGD